MRFWQGIIFLVIGLSALLGCQSHEQKLQGYIEGYFTYLSSNTDGFLQQLNVSRGNPVTQGQALFVLENQPEASRLAQATENLKQAQSNLTNLEKGQRSTVLAGIEAQLRQASAELDFAQKTFSRYQKLVHTDAISKSQFDQAQAEFKSANEKYNQTMASLNEAKLGARTDLIKAADAAAAAASAEANLAQWYLAKKTITAPANGTVYDSYYRNGEFVAAGHPVVSMLIPKDLRVIFYVPEPRLSQIKLGDEVVITCDGCKEKIPAKINFISPQAEFTPPIIFSEKERQKFVYRVEADFVEKDAILLHPGQPVDVDLQK